MKNVMLMLAEEKIKYIWDAECMQMKNEMLMLAGRRVST